MALHQDVEAPKIERRGRGEKGSLWFHTRIPKITLWRFRIGRFTLLDAYAAQIQLTTGRIYRKEGGGEREGRKRTGLSFGVVSVANLWRPTARPLWTLYLYSLPAKAKRMEEELAQTCSAPSLSPDVQSITSADDDQTLLFRFPIAGRDTTRGDRGEGGKGGKKEIGTTVR